MIRVGFKVAPEGLEMGVEAEAFYVTYGEKVDLRFFQEEAQGGLTVGFGEFSDHGRDLSFRGDGLGAWVGKLNQSVGETRC